MMSTGIRAAMALLGAVLLAACTVGPNYRRPTAEVPLIFKEAVGPAQGVWMPGIPADAMERGAWWVVYRDPVLDTLERQVTVSNQNLKAAEAAYRQAVAAVRAARAGFFPTIAASSFVQRQGSGSSRSSSRKASLSTEYDLGGTLDWEIDLWGRIRRTVESNVATAQASAGDLASARLSAQAALATDYLELRIADELKRLLDTAATAYAQSLQITRNQYAAGIASRADVVQAQTQLQTTQAESINVGVQRAQLEHAIAVLIGKPPAEFVLAPARLTMQVPVIPAGVPAALLERRPDIAAAERRVAAANAQIGVAQAAYYPDLTLGGSVAYASTAFGGLLGAANRVWALGPQLAQTITNGGLTGAQVEEARAAWEQGVADYRQTVLTAFQQVEDQLATLRILASEAVVRADAVASAKEAERLILNQYRAGTVAYTSVVTAQTAALNDEQAALTVYENRLTASVALIQALGGGWNASQLPTAESMRHAKATPPLATPAAAGHATPAAASSPSLFDRLGKMIDGLVSPNKR